MSSFNEASSSSDDDNILEAIEEAKDSQFLKETLFCAKGETGNNGGDGRSGPQKSLRRNIEFVDESNEFGVTQDFKNFVAKQLARSLDECVREVDYKNDTKSSVKRKREKTSSGIKLLTNSRVNLNDIEIKEEESIEHNKRRRKKESKKQESSAESISKCKEVAVQPDWILSKASTAVWTNRPKGTVYKYKKSDNGVLVEIN